MGNITKGINAGHRKDIESILRSTGFFYEFEIQTALEIADETIAAGAEKSGYYWMKVEDENGISAFANYGKILFRFIPGICIGLLSIIIRRTGNMDPFFSMPLKRM